MLGTRTSRWTAGTVALCVLLLVATWFLLVGPRRADAQNLQSARDSAQIANDQLALDIKQLKVQALQLPQRQADLAKIRTQFPEAAQIPTLIRDLDAKATLSGISLDSLTPGTPTAISAPPKAVSAASPAAGQSSAAAGQSAPAAGQSAAAGASSSGLLQVPLVLQVSGDYFQTAAFIKKLQTDRAAGGMDRALLITQIQMAKGDATKDPGQVVVTLTGQVFVWPDSETVTAPSPATLATPGAPVTSAGPPGNLTSTTQQGGTPLSQTTAPPTTAP